LKRIIATTEADLLLLGGDLVDRPSGLPQLSELVSAASEKCLVGAVGGNHDRSVGIVMVEHAVKLAGGVWLDHQPLTFSAGATQVVVSGAVTRQTPSADVSIRCMHYPNPFANAACEDDLVFVGHLHGCQMTAFAWRGRLYPGAWFYRWNGLRFTRRNSVMLVSRGLHDLVPVRVNCPREVVLCHCSRQEMSVGVERP
jgi:predicted MPP superfamily phosphohydrolase